MASDILRQVEDAEKSLIGLRRHLHENPELSGYEFQTLEFIRDSLTRLGIPFVEHPFGGILGFIENGSSDRTVLLRGDMDALPITELTQNLVRDKEVVSKNDGVAHMCGHDAHTAMLLTTAKILLDNIELIDGKIILCFERAEEGGGPDGKYGARALFPYFDEKNYKIDSVFAIHVNPHIDAGLISANEGGVMAGGSGFSVTLTGRSGHGSRPDEANHPLDCFVAIYQAITALRLKHISPFTPLTIAVPVVHTGFVGNVIDETLTFSGSARFLHPEAGERFVAAFKNIVEHTAAAYNCTYTLEGLFSGLPVINSAEESRIARDAIVKYAGAEHLTSSEPLMASEPMSTYIQRYTGVLAFLGIRNREYGSGAELHSARFDIDESSLKYGVAAYVGYALDSLPAGKEPGDAKA
ncbi:MAG: amidohydrolase [Oscillospiraceae bacterium]|nr:amidohydrolase [Oscillospiraceae bacterium]